MARAMAMGRIDLMVMATGRMTLGRMALMAMRSRDRNIERIAAAGNTAKAARYL